MTTVNRPTSLHLHLCAWQFHFYAVMFGFLWFHVHFLKRKYLLVCWRTGQRRTSEWVVSSSRPGTWTTRRTRGCRLAAFQTALTAGWVSGLIPEALLPPDPPGGSRRSWNLCFCRRCFLWTRAWRRPWAFGSSTLRCVKTLCCALVSVHKIRKWSNQKSRQFECLSRRSSHCLKCKFYRTILHKKSQISNIRREKYSRSQRRNRRNRTRMTFHIVYVAKFMKKLFCSNFYIATLSGNFSVATLCGTFLHRNFCGNFSEATFTWALSHRNFYVTTFLRQHL